MRPHCRLPTRARASCVASAARVVWCRSCPAIPTAFNHWMALPVCAVERAMLARTASRATAVSLGPRELTVGKPGWMEAGAVSCTIQPSTASMAMRPCLSSASRSTFTSNTSEKPRGSKPTSPGSEPSRLVGCLRKGTESEYEPGNTAIWGAVAAAHIQDTRSTRQPT